MSTLLNPQAHTEKETNIPANPFKVFINWSATAGKFFVRTGGETKDLKNPLEVIVLDYLNTIQAGEMGVIDIWSKPYYRLKSATVTVWGKQLASGKIAKLADGKVDDIYDKLRNDYKASKGVKVYVFIPVTGQIALLDLSGYAISPFYSAETSNTEPGLILNLEPVEVTPKPVYGTRYAPTFSKWEVSKEAAESAIDAFIQAGAIEYLNYMEGKKALPVPAEDEKTESETKGGEEENKKTSDPWG